MIELHYGQLLFSFPAVHSDAQLTITFFRTLRIPDDGKDYPLPPGLGSFPLMHVDDFSKTAPKMWLKHGGVFFPMYQSEALWLLFSNTFIYNHKTKYPFAIKVATGKINAVNGMQWDKGLKKNPQNYLVSPGQPWLDGYCVEKGIIRQFVAMPLGEGYTAEEQLTRAAEHGGIQVQVYPMKKEIFQKKFPRRKARISLDDSPFFACSEKIAYMSTPEMGLAPGGRMKQEIYKDPYKITDWDLDHTSRCFVHIANSLVWKEITGENPPDLPPTAERYSRAGLPWFEYYSDEVALEGSKKLAKLKSVKTMGQIKNEEPLPENTSVKKFNLIKLFEKPQRVREGKF